MELTGADLHATGRIVVLSNAVLFQPAALFKQVPGADYLWHIVTITLAPGADIASAEQRLESAAESVYDGYKESIERQHAALQRYMDVETSSPRVDVRIASHRSRPRVHGPISGGHAARCGDRSENDDRDPSDACGRADADGGLFGRSGGGIAGARRRRARIGVARYSARGRFYMCVVAPICLICARPSLILAFCSSVTSRNGGR